MNCLALALSGDTFSASTEADECFSHFHQQVVGTFPSPGGHLFGAYDHLKERPTSSKNETPEHLVFIDVSVAVFVPLAAGW